MPDECGSGTQRCETPQSCAGRGSHSAVQRRSCAGDGQGCGRHHSDTEKVLRRVLVMKEMGASGLDPVFLAIGVQLFLDPRVLRRDGHHVLPRATTSSILVGMKESGMYARNCSVALLEQVKKTGPCSCHKGLRGRCGTSCWTLVAAEHACDAAVPVAEAFEKRKLKVSYQKTTKVASSNKALAVTMAKLTVEGFHIEKGRSVRDWGVDNVGRRKGGRTATQKQRVANMARRARRQKLLTAWNTKARTLWNTPVWPTAGARHLRPGAGAKRDERHARKDGGPGGCCTMIDAVVHELTDGGIAIPFHTIKAWIRLSSTREQRCEAGVAWHRAKRRLDTLQNLESSVWGVDCDNANSVYCEDGAAEARRMASRTALPASYVKMRVLTTKKCSWNWPVDYSEACGARLPSTAKDVGLMMRED